MKIHLVLNFGLGAAAYGTPVLTKKQVYQTAAP